MPQVVVRRALRHREGAAVDRVDVGLTARAGARQDLQLEGQGEAIHQTLKNREATSPFEATTHINKVAAGHLPGVRGVARLALVAPRCLTRVHMLALHALHHTKHKLYRLQ